MPSITHSSAWKKLARHKLKLRTALADDKFWDDARRVAALSLELEGLYVDYSRNLVTPETLRDLMQLATLAGLPKKRQQLFEGGIVNGTEGRPALHTLLRAEPADVPRALQDKAADVRATLARMRSFTEATHASGRFTDVVNIGIGGSHLGPELVVEALKPLEGATLRTHFLSNVDPMQAARLLSALDPAKTLVIITSKTFTTQETLANAHAVRGWLVEALGEA